MRYYWLAFFLSFSGMAAAAPDSLHLSPGFLRRTLPGPVDSIDHIRSAAATSIRFEYFSDRSFFLLDEDTVLHPENGDELQIGYESTDAARMAYGALYDGAGNARSDIYKAFQSGAIVGRSGSWVVIRWLRRDIGRYDVTPARRYFRTRQFNESFEIYRTRRQLK